MFDFDSPDTTAVRFRVRGRACSPALPPTLDFSKVRMTELVAVVNLFLGFFDRRMDTVLGQVPYDVGN